MGRPVLPAADVVTRNRKSSQQDWLLYCNPTGLIFVHNKSVE